MPIAVLLLFFGDSPAHFSLKGALLRHAAKVTLIPAALLLCAIPLRSWAQGDGLRVGAIQRFPLMDSPFAGPVETLANTDHTTIRQGGLMDVFVAVQNHSTDATASVVIELELRYAGGALVQPFSLGTDRQQILGPEEGVGFYIFWQIPPDASLGTASLVVNATVGRLSGGTNNHSDYQNPMVASDSVPFEVTP